MNRAISIAEQLVAIGRIRAARDVIARDRSRRVVVIEARPSWMAEKESK